MGFIGIGKCSKYNIYILIGFLSEFFLSSILGMNSSNKENQGKLFYFIPKFKNHCLIRNLIFFLSSLLGSVFTFFLEKKNLNIKEGEITIKKNEKLQKKLLGTKKQNIYLGLFLTGFFLSFNLLIKNFSDLLGQYIGLWMFEIVYICILSYILLNIKINRHKIVAILIMIIPVLILEIISFSLPSTKQNCEQDECNQFSNTTSFEYIKIKWGVYFIPLIIIFNDLTNFFRDYSWVKAKYLMDIRSISPFKIFLAIGLIGSTLIVVLFSIFTNIPCNTYGNVILNEEGDYIYINSGSKIDFMKELCKLKYYDKDDKKLYIYFDNFSLFLEDYEKNTESYLEIFVVIPLYLIICFFLIFSHIMMIKHTDPNNILIAKNFFYFFKRIICFILNKGNEKYITYAQFFLLEFQEIISIISNMIYIEIIELKFCQLDFELKKNIKDRSDDDYAHSTELIRTETTKTVSREETQLSVS